MANERVLSWLLLSGLLAGFVFQRSRLCFVSALRDLYLFRALEMTRAILLSFLVTVAGGALLLADTGGEALEPVMGPTPLAALSGGAIFALGMVLAGSCAAGAFWRLGEGQLSQLWIMLGMLVGTWAYLKLPLLPEAVVQPTFAGWWVVALLALAWVALGLWERLRAHAGEEIATTHGFDLRRPWSPAAGAVVMAALLVGFMALTGRTWSVTRVFVLDDWSAAIFALGLTGGGFVGARFGHEWRSRRAGTGLPAVVRFVGGLLMGYGARVGWGCTIGAVLSGMVNLSVHPWYWLMGALVGAGAGAAILRRYVLLYL